MKNAGYLRATWKMWVLFTFSVGTLGSLMKTKPGKNSASGLFRSNIPQCCKIRMGSQTFSKVGLGNHTVEMTLEIQSGG